MKKIHIPVLKEEVIDFLQIKKNKNYIDCTVGEGGHTREILKRNAPNGRVLGFEWDKVMYERLKKDNIKRLDLFNTSYVFLKEVVKNNNFTSVAGVLLDLGMSTWHIKESGKGFTFQEDELLDMRYNTDTLLTAKDIVNKWKKEDIEKIIKEYSDEQYSEEIAENIVLKRPLETTKDLVKVINEVVPKSYNQEKINPATRTFQALRITVNAEIINIKEVLPQASKVLESGGKIVVISFHYLEDKEVEKFFKKREELKVITKKPITPSRGEIEKNPSSRSALLRVAEKK